MACYLRDNRGKKARGRATPPPLKQQDADWADGQHLNKQQTAQVDERVDEALTTNKGGEIHARFNCGSNGFMSRGCRRTRSGSTGRAACS